MLYVMRTQACVVLNLVAVVLAASGCDNRSTLSLPSPSSQFVEITSQFPSVVKVNIAGGRGICTGTFVSPRAVLTAAHCTQAAGTYQVVSSFGVYSTSTRVNYGGPAEVGDPNDIAFLIFSSDVADPDAGQVTRIGDVVAEGDTLRIVGFGCNNLTTRTGGGVKRTGTNMVYEVTDFIEFLTPQTSQGGSGRGILGPANRAGSCFGDSGGPAAQILSGDDLAIVGVAHAGGVVTGGTVSDYSDLTRNDNRAFIARVNADYDLGIAGF